MAQAASRLDVRLKRVYLPPSPDDGVRVLVDRLWPRGVRKSNAAVDRWRRLKEVAPTAELRRWFGHAAGVGRGFDDPFDRQIVGQLARATRLASTPRLGRFRRRDFGLRLFLSLCFPEVLDRQFELLGKELAAPWPRAASDAQFPARGAWPRSARQPTSHVPDVKPRTSAKLVGFCRAPRPDRTWNSRAAMQPAGSRSPLG